MAFIFIDANSANPMHGVIQKDSVITYNVLWCEHPPSGCNGRGQAMGMAVHALSFAVRVANARPLPAVDWPQPIGSWQQWSGARCFEPADLAVTARGGHGYAPLPTAPAPPAKASPGPFRFSSAKLALCTVALLSCTRSPPRHQPPRQVCPRRSRCSRRPAPSPPPRDGAGLGPSAGTSFRPGSAASAPPGERMR